MRQIANAPAEGSLPMEANDVAREGRHMHGLKRGDESGSFVRGCLSDALLRRLSEDELPDRFGGHQE
jgi:hypothetical protein